MAFTNRRRPALVRSVAPVLLGACLCGALAVLVPASAAAQESGAQQSEKKRAGARKERARKQDEAPSAVDPVLAAWMEAGRPGPEHQVLRALAGKWDVQATFWMAPGAPPLEASGVSTVKKELGGRFLREEYRSEVLGTSYRGLGFTGYDKSRKRYVSIWMDSMTTAILSTEGEIDESGKVLTFRGTFHDPARQKTIEARHVVRLDSATVHRIEMFEREPGAEERLTGKLTYTKRTSTKGREASKDRAAKGEESAASGRGEADEAEEQK